MPRPERQQQQPRQRHAPRTRHHRAAFRGRLAADVRRQPDFRRQRQMVGKRLRQRPHLVQLDRGRGQDVVQRPPRLPAGKGQRRLRRRLQAAFAEQVAHLGAVRFGIEVAHQHRMREILQQLGDETELARPRRGAQRQVRNHHRQRAVAFAELRQQGAAAGDPAGQRVIKHRMRLQPADQAVRRMGQPRHRPVRLVAPERHAGGFGKVAGLVEKARAQAAGIGLLQADQVELRQHLGQPVEVVHLAATGQHRVDAAGDVLAVALHAAAGQDVAAQQAQVGARWGRLGKFAARVIATHCRGKGCWRSRGMPRARPPA